MSQNLSHVPDAIRPADRPADRSADAVDGVIATEEGAVYSPLMLRRHQMYPCLTQAEIERVSTFGTRRQWHADDYVVRTGGPGMGMILVLAGHVRVLQRDGLERSSLITEHGRGNFLAEIGQLSGSPELVDGLALDEVDAVVIPPERLRALLVAEAELGERIMRALILRRAALIERGRGPILVGRSDDSRMSLLQSFLRRNNHPHTVIDIDVDVDAARMFAADTCAPRDLPLVVCPGGNLLRRPDTGQLASCLGLLPEFQPEQVYDVVIVGAGPAGLASAVYAASEGLCVTVLDSLSPGGQAGASARIENYLGFPTGISGQTLASRAFAQAQKFGAHIAIPLEVERLQCSGRNDDTHQVMLKDGRSIRTRAVVIACGAAYRRPPLPRLAEFEGRGVYYWASPVEARLCAKQEVVLVGGGNSAGQAAVYLATHAAHVHVVIRGPGLEQSMSRYLIDRIASQPNITVHCHTEVEALGGARVLDEVTLRHRDTDVRTHLDVHHVFLFTGAEPNTGWLRECDIRLDAKGFVMTGLDRDHGQMSNGSLQTSVPGIFAVGDVRSGSTKRVATAVGEGAAVISQIHTYLAAHATV